MSHGVPCVGYVVRERDRPGRLRPDLVLPIIERNRVSLIERGVVRNPMKVMAMIKNLPPGGSFAFPDGTVVRQEDVVEPPRKGRKIVICGDTADCRALEGVLLFSYDYSLILHTCPKSHSFTNYSYATPDRIGPRCRRPHPRSDQHLLARRG
jgi:ribonuclease BN (tRNA processing enzyme)